MQEQNLRALKAADENLDDEDILTVVNASLITITVTPDLIAKFWVQILASRCTMIAGASYNAGPARIAKLRKQA